MVEDSDPTKRERLELNKLIISIQADGTLESIDHIMETHDPSQEARDYLQDMLNILSEISDRYDALRVKDFQYEGYISDDDLVDLNELNMRIMKYIMFEEYLKKRGF